MRSHPLRTARHHFLGGYLSGRLCCACLCELEWEAASGAHPGTPAALRRQVRAQHAELLDLVHPDDRSRLQQEADDPLYLAVTDIGVGIDSRVMLHLFEAFKQESTDDTREFEGSGLGLVITKELVIMMDGEITAKSVKGEGTTFVVRLPPAPEVSMKPGSREVGD